MAENKEVVEMFDKFLASLIKLIKKWLIEWSVDTKKLLHALHNLRKEDIIGLQEGTHIIVRKTPANVVKIISSAKQFRSLIDAVNPKDYLNDNIMKNIDQILPLSIENDLSKYDGHRFGTETYNTIDEAGDAMEKWGYRHANPAELLYWIKETEEIDNIKEKYVIIGGEKYNKYYWVCRGGNPFLLVEGNRKIFHWNRQIGERCLYLNNRDDRFNRKGFYLAIKISNNL